MQDNPTGSIFLAILLIAGVSQARELSIPEYDANPGGMVEIPVVLDDAAGLSSLEFQVNFDPGLLDFLSIIKGSLGESFEEMIFEEDEGTANFAFASSENLPAGSGILAVMKFAMKEGAEVGLFSEVALASFSYGDSSGAVALHRQEASASAHGRIVASNDPVIDNFGNGLPDWWEDAHGLWKFTLDGKTQDLDHDGISNFLEYALVTNPKHPVVS